MEERGRCTVGFATVPVEFVHITLKWRMSSIFLVFFQLSFSKHNYKGYLFMVSLD